MVSELQKRKWTTLFAVYDANNNGVLDQKDFEQLVQRLAQLRGWQPGSSEYSNIHDKELLYWKRLQEAADKNRDEKVTLEEWLEYHEQLLSAADKYNEIESLSSAVFDLFNPDGKEKTTAEKWEEFFVTFNIPRVYVKYIFPKLDLNGDGILSKDEVLQLVSEFYLSDDPNARGNLLFGPHI